MNERNLGKVFRVCSSINWLNILRLIFHYFVLQPCNISSLHWLCMVRMICLQWVMPGGCGVCVCHFVCVHWSTSVFPVVRGFAGSRGPAEPHDSCSQQQFSSSFIHHMDTQLILNTEYHMARGTKATLCVCVCVRRSGGVFPTALAFVQAYLWIIIPFWNVTFQTQWPQADQRARDRKRGRERKRSRKCVCVCVCKPRWELLRNPCYNLCILSLTTQRGPCRHGNII